MTTKNNTQIMPALPTDTRAETGSMKFGDDWTGIFIRGDNAAYFSMLLTEFLKNPKLLESDIISKKQLENFAVLLSSCIE